jgi:WD40 repeat protein
MKNITFSRFRHIQGEILLNSKFENLKLQIKASDNPNAAVNEKYAAVPWASSIGGSVAILAFDSPGKIDNDVCLLPNHPGGITDLVFSPFSSDLLLTACEDSAIRVFNVESKLMNHQVQVLEGVHSRKVTSLACNTSADSVIASASFDGTLGVWDFVQGEMLCKGKVDDDFLNLVVWHPRNSIVMGITSQGKKGVLFDPRQGLSETSSETSFLHTGNRSVRVDWLSDTCFISTGASTQPVKREAKIWDTRKLVEPAQSIMVDESPGILYPIVDRETVVVLMAGRGDSLIRIFDASNGTLSQISEYRSPLNSQPQKSVVPFQRRSLDYTKNEILKIFKLDSTSANVISFSLPRKSELVQAELYPPCFIGNACCSSKEWKQGGDHPPKLESMLDQSERFRSKKKIELSPTVVSNESECTMEGYKRRVKDLESENLKLKSALEELREENVKLKKLQDSSQN